MKKGNGFMIDYLVVGLVILGVILSVRYIRRQARSGKDCCGGCAGCGMHCHCPKEEENK